MSNKNEDDVPDMNIITFPDPQDSNFYSTSLRVGFVGWAPKFLKSVK